MSFDTQKEHGGRSRAGKTLKQRQHEQSVRVQTVPREGVALWRLRNRRFDRLANKSIRKATAANNMDGQLSSRPSAHTTQAPWTFIISKRTVNRIVEAELSRAVPAATEVSSSLPVHFPVQKPSPAAAGWSYTSQDAYNGCRVLLEWGRPLQQPNSPASRTYELQAVQQACIVRTICRQAQACGLTDLDMHRQQVVLEACHALGKVDSRTDASRAKQGSASRLHGMGISRKGLGLAAAADFGFDEDSEDSDEAEEGEGTFGGAAQSGLEGNWSLELQPPPAASSASEDDSGSDAEFILIDHQDARTVGDEEPPAAADEQRSMQEPDMAEREQQYASSPPSGPIVLDLQQLIVHASRKRASKRKTAAQHQHWQHLAGVERQQEQQQDEWPELSARPLEEDAFVIV